MKNILVISRHPAVQKAGEKILLVALLILTTGIGTLVLLSISAWFGIFPGPSR
jgi:hypothetical protein